MPFFYSGGVITQTGTDTSLSGLSGLTGVTVETGTQTVYTLTATRLEIDGSLTVDASTERLAFDNSTLTSGNIDFLDIGSTGSYTSTCTLNGVTRNDIIAIDFGTYTMGGFSGRAAIRVQSGGSLDVTGGMIIWNASGNGRFCDPIGNVDMTDVQLINYVDVPGSCQFSGNSSAVMNFTRCLFRGVNFNIKSTDYISTLNNCQFQDSADALVSNTGVETVVSADSLVTERMSSQVARILGSGLACFNFSNPEDGNDILINQNVNGNDKYAFIYQDIAINIVDDNGANLTNAAIYAQDIDNGNRQPDVTIDGTTFDIGSTFTYSGTGGTHNFNVLTQVRRAQLGDSSGTTWAIVDNRGTSNGANFPWNMIEYNKGIASTTFNMQGIAPKTFEQVLLPDTLITEGTKATVDAYSTIDTAQEFYDRAKSYLVDNYTGQTSTLISRTANVAECGGGNIILDATAANAFSFTSGTPNTFTLHTDTFTGGITTTGTITVQNGALLSGGTFTGDITTTDTGVTYTNITATKIIHTTASTATITLDGGSVTEIEVTGGGTLTVNLLNGATVTTQTETSGTIILVQNVTVTDANLIDGTRVQLYNVTKASELDNSLISGGGGYNFAVNLQSSIVDIGDTLRLRATYTSGASGRQPLESTGIISASGLTFLNTQENDSVYNELGLDGSTITKFTADYVDDEIDIVVASNFSAAELYAWWAYNLTTPQGISDFYGGVNAVDSANFEIVNSIINVFLDNTTATNVFQTDNRRLYRSDLVRPVKNPTTGGGGIDIEWRSPVSLANIDSFQEDIDEVKTNTVNILGITGASL